MTGLDKDREFIFLDVGGTLVFPPRLEIILFEGCASHGVRVEVLVMRSAMERALRRMSSPHPTWLDPTATRRWWDEFLHRVLDEISFTGNRERLARELWDEYRAGNWMRLFPDTIEALEYFRQNERRLGIISNWDDTLEHFLGKLGIRKYFDVVVSSYAAGYQKPDARIFYRALDLAEASPESAWHVGDDVTLDYLGASAVGMRPILVDYFGNFTHGKFAETEYAQGEEITCPIVTSLKEAAALIITGGKEMPIEDFRL